MTQEEISKLKFGDIIEAPNGQQALVIQNSDVLRIVPLVIPLEIEKWTLCHKCDNNNNNKEASHESKDTEENVR